jgi:hypothetical protein
LASNPNKNEKEAGNASGIVYLIEWLYRNVHNLGVNQSDNNENQAHAWKREQNF